MAKKQRVRKKGMNPSLFTQMFMQKLESEMIKRGMCTEEQFKTALNESEVMKNGKNDSSNTDRAEELQQ